jgi:hypothetical protein
MLGVSQSRLAVTVAKVYDSLGRLQKQSRPYFAASGTPPQ